MSTTATPDHIMQVGMGFFASKTLLSAVELELFTVLGDASLTASEVSAKLDLHERSHLDFLDALVSLGFLDRDGTGNEARYANTAETAIFLDKQSPAYLGGMLEMANSRLYSFWSNLTEGLQTGRPQNEVKTGGDFFTSLYSDELRLAEFLRAMQGLQTGNHHMLLEKVDMSQAKTFCDVGGANGALSVLVAQRYPNITATTFDLAPVAPFATEYVTEAGVADRVGVVSGDFFADDWPRADVIVLGNVLHDWDEEHKQVLIDSAFTSLTDGGRFIAIENIIDDDRRRNTFGLLMSLNMLIEMEGGFDYTGAQFDAWCRSAGFARTEVVPLAGPGNAAIAYK
jgi:hypothetical protein